MQLCADEVIELRKEHYNARVERIVRVTDDLMILRVVPDDGVPPFTAGQYTTLGLGTWESRVGGLPPEMLTRENVTHLIRRAYSVSCSLLDEGGSPVRACECPYLEFYISLVRSTQPSRPMLTPRLFLLREGARLTCGPHCHGHYTTSRVDPERHVLFAATGTGEAPHNAMLIELLTGGHRGRIVFIVCVRWKRDLAYFDAHRQLERRYANYCYVPITTRESVNLDPAAVGYVGKRYMQDYVESGELERAIGMSLSAENTHIFLCGSPQMIGVPHHTRDLLRRYPVPKGMVEVFERRGFKVDQPHEPGNIHFEKYW